MPPKRNGLRRILPLDRNSLGGTGLLTSTNDSDGSSRTTIPVTSLTALDQRDEIIKGSRDSTDGRKATGESTSSSTGQNQVSFRPVDGEETSLNRIVTPSAVSKSNRSRPSGALGIHYIGDSLHATIPVTTLKALERRREFITHFGSRDSIDGRKATGESTSSSTGQNQVSFRPVDGEETSLNRIVTPSVSKSNRSRPSGALGIHYIGDSLHATIPVTTLKALERRREFITHFGSRDSIDGMIATGESTSSSTVQNQVSVDPVYGEETSLGSIVTPSDGPLRNTTLSNQAATLIDAFLTLQKNFHRPTISTDVPSAVPRRIRKPSTVSMEGNVSDSASWDEVVMQHAVLHTAEQRKTSEDHVEMLRKDGKNAVSFSCSDTSWLAATNMGILSSLHLIVDTCMYGILMSDGRLCGVAFRKFNELAKAGKRIYVLNTFPTEFNELYHQIPRNARTLLNDESTSGQSNEGDVTKISAMTGSSATDSVVAGTVDGNMLNVYGTFINVQTGENYEISGTRIKDNKNGPSVTIGQGTPTSSQNQLVVAINGAENNQEIFDEVTHKKEKLKSNPVREVETELGSVIIKLTVDKTHIMTDAWIQTVLKTIFYDILRDFFTEGTQFQVTVNRNICIGEEEFLKLYSSHQSHDDCVPKTEFDSLKSKLEEAVALNEKCSFSEDSGAQLVIKREPIEEDPFERKPLLGKSFEGKSFEGKSFVEKPIEREQFEEKPFGGKSFELKPFEGESFEEKRFGGKSKPLEGSVLEEQTLKRKLLEEEPFGTFKQKMRRFTAMYKTDPELDMKQAEIDHLMAEIQSLHAELDYLRDQQILKTNIVPRGRMRCKQRPKMLDYEDVMIDQEQKVIFQKTYGSSLRHSLKDVITSGLLDIDHRNKKGMSLVMVSALNGDKDIFDLLVENGCSLSDCLPNGDNILHLACLGGNVDIVDFILTHNIADIESKGIYGRTPVMQAASAGQKEVFDLLVGKGCNLNVVGTDYNKLLHVACMGDNDSIVKFLLDRGADIEGRGMYGRTPVMIAASLGKKKVFVLLVRYGCDLAVTGSDRNNILHVACMSDCEQIVHFLIAHGQANMESRGIYGKTAVMIAAERGNKRVFDLLVRKGCDLLVEDRHCNNILHAAVKGGNLQIINDILLEVHLDPESKNYFGQTVFNLAMTHSRDQLPLIHN